MTSQQLLDAGFAYLYAEAAGADGPAIACEVADFDAAIADLRGAGVKFAIEPMDSGVCRLAVVLDPAGNSLAIHQRKAAS